MTTTDAADYERVTVGLIPKASAALDRITAVEQLNRADAVNRALQLYAFVLEEISGKGGQLAAQWPNGDVETVDIVEHGEAPE